jgi:hypothetical protein
MLRVKRAGDTERDETGTRTLAGSGYKTFLQEIGKTYGAAFSKGNLGEI